MEPVKTVQGTASSAPLTWGTRISYGLGDTACNVVFGMITALLTLFYTDYCGISVASVGLVMLISRIFDGTFRRDHGHHRQSHEVPLGQGAPVDLVDGRALRHLRHRDVLRAAVERDHPVLVYLCHL